MTEPVGANRQTKNSVFCDLFSRPEYLLQLYQALHPEDKTAQIKDLKDITVKCVVAEHPYNDLGFRINNNLMILVEAQSTWSPNILLRMLNYLAESYVNYYNEEKVSLYNNHKVNVPKPELYVIFTGERVDKPETLSLSEYFFDGEMNDVEIRAKMIYDSKTGDIIYQYITFCKVFDQQRKKYGLTLKAIHETIRICSDANILKAYLKERESELMDMMTYLFDQETVTRDYGEAKWADGKAEGINEGISKGKAEGKAEAILNIVNDFGVSVDKAMDVLKIPDNERNDYRQRLAAMTNGL